MAFLGRELLAGGFPPGPRTTLGREARLVQKTAMVKKLERRVHELGAELEAQLKPPSRGTEREARGRFFQTAGSLAPIVGVESAGATYMVSSADQGAGRALFVDQHREELVTLRTAMAVLSELDPSKVTNGRLFLDVGANIGTSTIPALLEHGFARALCCEPDPANFRLLRLNIVANELEARVQTLQLALSDTSGAVGLALSESNWGDHRVVATDEEREALGRRRQIIEVERTTLDQLLDRQGITPAEVGLVWIDAQGHEPEILAGARSVIDAGVPVVFEFLAKRLERNGGLRRLENLFREVDGKLIDLSPGSGGTLEGCPLESLQALADAYSASKRHTDLLLVPRA
jgi:FkbM family methyltransferase